MILTFGLEVIIFFSRLTLFSGMDGVSKGGRKSSSDRPSQGSYCFEQSEIPDDVSEELLPKKSLKIIRL